MSQNLRNQSQNHQLGISSYVLLQFWFKLVPAETAISGTPRRFRVYTIFQFCDTFLASWLPLTESTPKLVASIVMVCMVAARDGEVPLRSGTVPVPKAKRVLNLEELLVPVFQSGVEF